MKIDTNRISFEGLTLKEEVIPSELDLETEIIKFRDPIKVKADISKITNAVTANLDIFALMNTSCSRCLNEFEIEFKKNVQLNYAVSKSESMIDLDPAIREEIVLDYPIKPLCSPDCKGLCPKCGKNLNEGVCKCVSL